MKPSPEYSPRRRDLLKRVFSLGVAVAAQPLLGTLGIFDGQVTHAQEASAPENGSAQLIQAIEATASNIPTPNYEDYYPGKSKSNEGSSNTVFRKAIAASLIADLGRDAEWFQNMSKQPGSVSSKNSNHTGVVYLRYLNMKSIDEDNPNLAPAKQAPLTIFESTFQEPTNPNQYRQQFFVVINGDFDRMVSNESRWIYLVANIAEYARLSFDKEDYLMKAEQIKDPKVLNAKMQSAEIQGELAKQAGIYAAKATLAVLESENGEEWHVEGDFRKELENLILLETNIANTEQASSN